MCSLTSVVQMIWYGYWFAFLSTFYSDLFWRPVTCKGKRRLYQFQMSLNEDVSNYLIFQSTIIFNSRERRILDIPWRPFKSIVNKQSQFVPPQLNQDKSAMLDDYKNHHGLSVFLSPTLMKSGISINKTEQAVQSKMQGKAFKDDTTQ